MVTATQISNYLASIYEAQSIYTDRLVLKERLGHTDLTEDRILMTLLGAYVEIMTEYFSQSIYQSTYFVTTNNFFEPEEVEDIMLRINLIADTNYSLELE